MAYATPQFTLFAKPAVRRRVARNKLLPSPPVLHSFSATPPTSCASLTPEYDGPPSPTSTWVGSDDSHERIAARRNKSLPSPPVLHSFSSSPPTSCASLTPDSEYAEYRDVDGPPSPTSTLVGSDDSHKRGYFKDKLVLDGMPHLIALADWVAVVLVCTATGQTPTVLQTVSELSFSATYEDLHGFVYDLIISQHQTPFTLFHIVAYATLYFEKVEPLTLRELEENPKNVEAFRQLMLILFFVALDQFTVDPLPLETRARLTGLTVDQVLEAQKDVLETLGSYVQMPRDVWNIYTEHFRVLCAQSWLPVHNDHDIPAIVNAFLTLSDYASSIGALPLCEVPPRWLVPSITKQTVPPIARP
ncbi:uncharacterized protein EV420DRAFT_1638495 [Desarmillaria tabescens]|uniref:Uncharacterized protein n=1 Tax=Armillaria tabescens TaxID=1929756 RepID=A0AA39NDC5_ARMTA|nr:uncharacterized protein EV420DRAFT_1638495 [Desarmillaria tabescens]KAK0463563.1 hypothetical protein EV420DRAFT_1638495 [Desarmillaria tabescens]